MLDCDHADEVYEEDLGAVDGGPVHLRACTEDVKNGQQALVRVRWEPPESELGGAGVWQTLVDGVVTATAGAFNASLHDDVLTLAWPDGGFSDPAGQTTTQLWRWNAEARRFVRESSRTTSPWAESQTAMHAALDKGDFAAARAAVEATGSSPNGGRSWMDDQIYLDFLDATVREALRRHRAWDKAGAAAIIQGFFDDPPVSSPEATPQRGQILLCRGLAPTCSGKGSFEDLPVDAHTGNLLAASAFLLERGGKDEDAVRLLQPVLAAFPESGGLDLTLGDALWDLGRKEEARAAYGQYLTLAEAPVARRARRRAAR